MSAGNSIDTLQVLYKRSPEGRSVADEKIHYSIIEEKIDKYKEKYQEAPAGSQEEKAAKAGLGIWNHRAKAYTDEGKARVVANQYYYRRNEVEKDKMPHYRAWTAHANALKEAKKFRV